MNEQDLELFNFYFEQAQKKYNSEVEKKKGFREKALLTTEYKLLNDFFERTHFEILKYILKYYELRISEKPIRGRQIVDNYLFNINVPVIAKQNLTEEEKQYLRCRYIEKMLEYKFDELGIVEVNINNGLYYNHAGDDIVYDANNNHNHCNVYVLKISFSFLLQNNIQKTKK